MGAARGLAEITNKINERQQRMEGGQRKKTDWVKLKDGDSIRVVFLQEFDEDSENYSSKNGLLALHTQHQAGTNWRNTAQCTIETEGACYACERNREEPRQGWAQKQRLYVNVLVDDGENKPYVAVLSQSTSAQSITPSLLEQATELGTITDKWFKITRRGTEKDTSYILTPLRAHDENVEGYADDLFDLDTVVPNPSYDQQEAHYRRGEEAPAEKAEVPQTASSSADDEW